MGIHYGKHRNKGFLSIEYAKFEIKKINVLIGAQAQGKSVIAKLVYFFKNIFSKVFIESIREFRTRRDVDKACLTNFEQIFPNYAWKDKEFSIHYDYGGYEVSITRTKRGNRYTTKVECCDQFMTEYQELKRRYKIKLNGVLQGKTIFGTDMKLESIFGFFLEEEECNFGLCSIQNKSFLFLQPLFFVTLQKNIFSFLASNVEIDYFIKEFGSYYEMSKIRYRNCINNAASDKVERLAHDILSGEYVYEEQQDGIIYRGLKTNLINASSGQQKSLPLLLVLKMIPFLIGDEQLSSFFIEEPEAHLFPSSQKHIISIIATIHNTFGHPFFITTHSPYILTAINNLVVGKDAYEKAQGNAEQLATLEKVLPADELIRLEDVSAYTLRNGKLESIIDVENRLIGANLLDSVSDEFNAAFSVATEILYGDN